MPAISPLSSALRTRAAKAGRRGPRRTLHRAGGRSGPAAPRLARAGRCPKRDCDRDKPVLVLGSPGSGKTTIATLLEFRLTEQVLRNQEVQSNRDLAAALHACGFAEEGVPVTAGVRLRDDVKLAMSRILLYRYANRVPQQSLAIFESPDPEPSRLAGSDRNVGLLADSTWTTSLDLGPNSRGKNRDRCRDATSHGLGP